MKRHLLSFLRSPLGYVANFLATVTVHCGETVERVTARPIIWACETFAVRDGVQDDMLF
jgi:hypothetical protein